MRCSAVVEEGCGGGFRAGARLRVPPVPGPVPGWWRETTLGRQRRPGDDGDGFGDGDGGPRGRDCGPAGGGGGSSAGRPGGAVLLHAGLDGAAGGTSRSRRAGESDRGAGPGTAAAAA